MFLPEKADFSDLVLTGDGQVQEVLGPLRLRLTDGRIVQLSSLHIPDLTPYDGGDISLAAQALLTETLTNKQIRIYQTKRDDKGRQNRMGHLLAQIEVKNGELWVQGLLLKNGLALVMPTKDNIEMSAQMSALEQEARTSKIGMWADDGYTVYTPETASEGLNSWGIVEGTVRAAASVRNTYYLNFGTDWKTDFTIGIPSDIRRTMSAHGIDLALFTGRRVRVHGWLESYNGPYIELFSPAWIEVLPDESQSSTLPAENN